MSNLLQNRPKLPDLDRTGTDAPIELVEIEDSLAIQKNLGPNGISGEFYKRFQIK